MRTLLLLGLTTALVAPPRRVPVRGVAPLCGDAVGEDADEDVERPPDLEASAVVGDVGRSSTSPTFRAGFVGVVGSPNVGKSTLTNALLGQDLCIATSKAQTTRHRILGVANGDDYQLVLSDTPGILGDPAYALQSTMMTAAKAATRDAECVLFVTDVFEADDVVAASVAWMESQLPKEGERPPVVVALNKVDLLGRDADGFTKLGEDASRRVGTLEDCLARARNAVPDAVAVVPVSALDGDVDELARLVADQLPLSEQLFDADYFTDRPSRFFAAEIVREQILQQFSKEIPYSCEVRIDRFKEDVLHKGKPFVAIDAHILVSRDSQKGILIGHQGKAIKEVGTAARKRLEAFFEAKVHLALRVKVSKDWRSDDAKLRTMGYPV